MREGKIGIKHHSHIDLGFIVTLNYIRDTEDDLEKAER